MGVVDMAENPDKKAKLALTRVVGVQSGNAVDGIDVGIFDFEEPICDAKDPRLVTAPIKYTTLANKTFTYTAEEREYVLSLRRMRFVTTSSSNCPGSDRLSLLASALTLIVESMTPRLSHRLEDGNEYALAHYKMGEWFAKRVNDLIEESGISKDSIHIIGSHGQTVSGHPHWELGDISVIAQLTGITTIGDFRTADVAAGGNGTPCTCTYDSVMLRPPPGSDKWRIAINYGGTSSVTFCPPQGDESVPIGLDPGLGVFFMDLCVRCIDPSLEYDDNGNIARTGKVNELLLAEFLENKYYKQESLPIGVGPDDFPETLFHEWRARAKELGVGDVDLLTTLTELTCKQVALACKKFGGENVVGVSDDIIIRGGVRFNGYFMERMKSQMGEQLGVEIDHLKTLEELGLDEDSWENALYALMGYLNFKNKYNFVPSCTGAKRSVVGGKLAPGENFHRAILLN